jgi:hypothetical protein
LVSQLYIIFKNNIKEDFMKKFISIFTLLVIFIGCNRDKSIMESYNDMQYREIAWNCLSAEEKESVTHDWRKAEVSHCLYWETKQDAVCVTFHTKYDPLIAPIIVFIKKDTLKILGFGIRE